MSRRPSTLERHYTPREVAELLSVHPDTIYRAIRRGRATRGRDGIWPVVVLSRSDYRVPASAAARYLERRRG